MYVGGLQQYNPREAIKQIMDRTGFIFAEKLKASSHEQCKRKSKHSEIHTHIGASCIPTWQTK